MKKITTPTIEEISDLFIPQQFRDYIIISEITLEEIFLDIKKEETYETKMFLEQFLQIAKMIGMKLNINKNI